MDVAAEPHRRVAEIWIADAHFVPVPASADYGTQSPRLCVSVDDNEDETLFLLPSFFFLRHPLLLARRPTTGVALRAASWNASTVDP